MNAATLSQGDRPVLDLAVFDKPVLDLADLAGPVRKAARGRIAAAVLAAVLLAGAMAAGWSLLDGLVRAPEVGAQVRIALDTSRQIAALTVDDRSQILAEGGDAATRNAAIPFAQGAASPMRAFNLHAAAPVAATALRCLTQAVYFEAANEPIDGRRAVAQVVLNRMRHPAYPKSVCGVVYQGSERTTGCQFSFTCDGALLRAPMARQWREAEQVAREALAGRVEASVGTATHYHADYVLPRWAFELAKVKQLGRHLFYRFGGNWGRTNAFTGLYSAREAIPALDFSRLRARLLADGVTGTAPGEFVPGTTVTPHVTDRHAENDVGGRLDTTREWRLSIPDPVQAASHYRSVVEGGTSAAAAGQEAAVAAAPPRAESVQ